MRVPWLSRSSALIRKADKALAHIPALLAMAPDWNLAHRAYALVLSSLKRHEEALEAAHRSGARAPRLHRTAARFARQLLELGRAEEAWEHIELAVALPRPRRAITRRAPPSPEHSVEARSHSMHCGWPFRSIRRSRTTSSISSTCSTGVRTARMRIADSTRSSRSIR